MDDLISRSAALVAMETWDKFGCDPDGKLVRYDDDKHYIPYVHYEDMVHAIKHLPSAQPEIIKCKDCKYASLKDNGKYIYCQRTSSFPWHDDSFCSDAERRM